MFKGDFLAVLGYIYILYQYKYEYIYIYICMYIYIYSMWAIVSYVGEYNSNIRMVDDTYDKYD